MTCVAVTVPTLRAAMCAAVRTQDVVHETLGRFAQPAEGLLPPGVLGHDAARRRRPASISIAIDLLRESGLETPVRLQAAIHPILEDRYAPLTQALIDAWKKIGVEIVSATPTMDQFLNAWKRPEEIDLMIGRWVADYEDPDNFTYGLFHSRMGEFRKFYSSLILDELIEQARSESRPGSRERLYRRVEAQLLDENHFLPLFHDIDYRIASPRIRGMAIRGRAPFVNYVELGKDQQEPATTTPRGGGGTIQVPIAGVLHDLDPSLVTLVVQSEIVPAIFETLTRESDDARIEPWLAEEFRTEEGGRRFRFRLRDDVRFHDGRRLSARDVRWSFERLLQNQLSHARWPLTPVKGAKRLLDGESRELEGFKILSASEFTIELDEPVSFFPALLAYTSAAIIPDGSDPSGGREQPIGTGPFRVSRFEPGKKLELEAHSNYWRRGLPRADGMVFHFGIPPRDIEAGFRSGRYMLAWDLLPDAIESLRHEPAFASNYREIPRLGTYFVVFNIKSGPLADEALRHRLIASLNVPALVRRTHARLAIPAHGLIPPGLLGYEPAAPPSPPPLRRRSDAEPIPLRAMVNSAYEGAYARLFEGLVTAFREAGFTLTFTNYKEDYSVGRDADPVDVSFTRWIADYPDADTFIHGLLHSAKGHIARFIGLPEIDRLIEWGRTETNPVARHRIYREVEEVLRQRGFLMPLFHEQAYRFARPEIQSFDITFSDPVVAYEKLWLRKT